MTLRPLLFLLPSLLLAACPGGIEENLEVAPLELDFGEIPVSAAGSQALTISNLGGTDVNVTFRLAEDDGPFGAPADLAVFAGDVRVVFASASPTEVGVVSGSLRVAWGDDSSDFVDVPLSLTGLPGGDDADGDGFAVPEDCDDTDDTVYPGAQELCDGLDNDCNDVIDDTVDADSDGVFDCDDCDDGDPDNYPGNDEACDNQDNDCDDDIDEGFDFDGDGVVPCGDEPDCNDSNSSIYPGAPEVCNGLDDDCDDDIDEDFLGPADDVDQDGEPGCTDCNDEEPASYHGAVEVCDGLDNDCDLAIDEDAADLDGDTWDSCSDCDDGNGAVHPGATEICDWVDNNCEGGIDEGFDLDGDGESTCDGDCDDEDTAVSTSATEVCDGIYNNCIAGIDEGFDLDIDGVTTCGPDGLSGTDDDDCDDTDSNNYPGNTEVCDGLDNDCDAAVYPGAPEQCDGVLDNDCDGLDDSDEADADGDGESLCEGDCDDGDALVYSGADEVCGGGVDLDCDGVASTCTTCLEALDDDPSRTTGLYTIDPDGAAGASAPFDAWCDMDTDGGGWTRIIRTSDDFSSNLALITDYVSLYFTTYMDPTGTTPLRVAAELWEALAEEGDILVRHDLRTVSGTSCGPLYYALTDGTLSVAVPGSGNDTTYAWSGLNLHHVVNGISPAYLSTTDQGPHQSCVNSNGRVPWFFKLGCGYNAPTIAYYGSGQNQPAVGSVILGTAGLDLYGNDETTVCSEDLASPPTAPSGWVAENLQEYYLR